MRNKKEQKVNNINDNCDNDEAAPRPSVLTYRRYLVILDDEHASLVEVLPVEEMR